MILSDPGLGNTGSSNTGFWQKFSGVPAKIRRLSRSLAATQAYPDDAWAVPRLASGELKVYLGMDARDREHAVRVAKALLEAQPDAAPELLSAALLHDCGKQLRPYRVWERVAAGLVPGRLARWLPVGALWVRGHHPELGARLLKAAGARSRVAELVERHHRPGTDAGAKLLHQYDNLE
jgi:putative nucleotidyltransferase with HDIG domain